MAEPPKIDRQTTTPFPLRLYYRQSSFHQLTEFQVPPPPGVKPPSHLQIYTWPNVTLRELTHLLTSALPNLLPSPSIGTRLSFRLVFPDTSWGQRRPDQQGRWIARELGSVVVGQGGEGVDLVGSKENGNGVATAALGKLDLSNLQGDAEKTLADARFVIGDYVSCAIFPPLADGSINRDVPPVSGGRSYSARGAGAEPYPPRRGSEGMNGYGKRGPPPPRGGGGYGGGGYGRGGGDFGRRGGYDGLGRGGVPSGEWRRGEVPQGPPGGFRGGRSGRGGGRMY